MGSDNGLRRIMAAVAILATVCLGGCILHVESDSRYRHGSLTLDDSLDAIEVGQTSRQWVVDRLGRPDSTYVNARGNEVLRYLSRRETDVEVAFLLLFSFDLSEEELQTLHIEIEDDSVRSYWID